MTLQRYEHVGAAPQVTLAGNMLATDTSFTVSSGTGYPTGAGGKLFMIGVDCGLPTEEHIICSARSGATFTVSGGVAGRGADNTVASAHTAPTATVEHIVGANEIDDDNDHIYTTTRDDHTQYSRTDGTRAFTGGVTINTGGLTVSGGGAAVVGNSSVTGTLSSSGALTVSAGGAAITGTAAVTGNVTSTGTMTPIAYRARYYVGVAGTVPGSAYTLFKYTNQDYDPNSLYSVSTGLFTVPAGGYYRVYAQYGMQTPGTGFYAAIGIYKNGTAHATSQIAGQPGTINTYTSVSDVISCATSDTLAVYNFTNGTSNFYSYVSTISDTFVTFERVG